MIFVPTELPGVIEIRLNPHRDDRGFFARLYCPVEFAAAGIDFTPSQLNLSRNPRLHTLRGLHYQDPPHAEAKLVRVTAGCIHDVVVDLRRDQPTYGRHIARRLDAAEGTALFLPEGCAHGFLTLAPETDVLYQMGRPHVPGQARGLRYDDPALAIDWPASPALISESDLMWPGFPVES